MLISKKGHLLISLFFLIIYVPRESLWADLTSGAAPFFLDVNPGMGSNVSYLVIDDSSLGTAPVIFGWHYNGLTNPVTHTNWSGTDLLNGVISKLRGSPNQLSYSLGAYGLTVSYTFRGVTSITVDPLDSPVWSYWIKGGSEYVPYGDTGDFTFNAPATSWVISPNTSDTRWLTNGSFDGWTISPFSFIGASSDTHYYLDTTGSNQPVTFGTYSGAVPLSAVPPPIVPLPQTLSPFYPVANRAFSITPFGFQCPVASSGLPVTIETSPPGLVSLSNSKITMLGVGTVTLTASQVGNANFSPAAPVTTSFVIKRSFQTIRPFAPIASRVLSSTPFTISLPVSTSGLPVIVTASPSNRVSISGNTITMLGTGLVTMTASQGGTSNFYPASQVSTRFLIAPIRSFGK